MTNSDEPVPPGELYDRHADEFADATQLDELPEEFLALLDSFVEALPGPRVLDVRKSRFDFRSPSERIAF